MTTNETPRSRADEIIARLDALTIDDDDAFIAARSLLIDDNDRALDATDDLADELRTLIRDLLDNHRDAFSRLLLDYSLCPLHRCDYAICFDDDDPDCAQIRAIFPSHDT